MVHRSLIGQALDWKDKVISDNAVHPVARETVYHSFIAWFQRPCSQSIGSNSHGQVNVDFQRVLGSTGGYMSHEEPAEGCVREAQEELGITVELEQRKPVITQRSFSDGVSFVSFTWRTVEWFH